MRGNLTNHPPPLVQLRQEMTAAQNLLVVAVILHHEKREKSAKEAIRRTYEAIRAQEILSEMRGQA